MWLKVIKGLLSDCKKALGPIQDRDKRLRQTVAGAAQRKNKLLFYNSPGFLSFNMLHYSFLEINQIFKWNKSKDFIISYL